MNKIFKKIKESDLRFEITNHTGWISIKYENNVVTINHHSLAWKLEQLLDKMFLIASDKKINQNILVKQLLKNKSNWTITTKELTEEEIKVQEKNVWATFNKPAELLKILKQITFDKDIFV